MSTYVLSLLVQTAVRAQLMEWYHVTLYDLQLMQDGSFMVLLVSL